MNQIKRLGRSLGKKCNEFTFIRDGQHFQKFNRLHQTGPLEGEAGPDNRAGATGSSVGHATQGSRRELPWSNTGHSPPQGSRNRSTANNSSTQGRFLPNIAGTKHGKGEIRIMPNNLPNIDLALQLDPECRRISPKFHGRVNRGFFAGAALPPGRRDRSRKRRGDYGEDYGGKAERYYSQEPSHHVNLAENRPQLRPTAESALPAAA